MDLREKTKWLIRQTGYTIGKFDSMHWLARRMSLLRHFDINLILDAGANVGQYSSLMRQYGYSGRIVSFEPLSAAFAQLSVNARGDKDWTVVNTGLGDQPGTATINIAEDIACSSILGVTDKYLESARTAAYVGQEEIRIETLDRVFDQYYRPGDRVFLKMDVQGYEMRVLEGASTILDRIVGLQLELSLVPSYEGETLFADMTKYLEGKGFTLMSVEPVHAEHYGQQIQVDGIYYRADAARR